MFTLDLKEAADRALGARAAALGKSKTEVVRELVADFLSQPISDATARSALVGASGGASAITRYALDAE